MMRKNTRRMITMTRKNTKVNMGKRIYMERKILSLRKMKIVPVLYNSLKKKSRRYTQSKNRYPLLQKSVLILSQACASMVKVVGRNTIKRPKTKLLKLSRFSETMKKRKTSSKNKIIKEKLSRKRRRDLILEILYYLNNPQSHYNHRSQKNLSLLHKHLQKSFQEIKKKLKAYR
jgi:hypothetical protein